jgi:hypothetical protein
MTRDSPVTHNTSAQPRPEAGARHERTLEGVGCSALLAEVSRRQFARGFIALFSRLLRTVVAPAISFGLCFLIRQECDLAKNQIGGKKKCLCLFQRDIRMYSSRYSFMNLTQGSANSLTSGRALTVCVHKRIDPIEVVLRTQLDATSASLFLACGRIRRFPENILSLDYTFNRMSHN